MPIKNALDIIKSGAWKHFDGNVVDAFFTISLDKLVDVFLSEENSALYDENDKKLLSSVDVNYLFGILEKEEEVFLKDLILYKFQEIDMIILIGMFIIIASSIADEFNKGTIKQLLVKPHSRSKILLSKMIASLIAILAFIIVYNSIFILANCYEYSDFTSIFGTNAVYDFNLGKVKEISVLGHCLYGFISVLPAYLIIFALVVFIGTLTTSTIATVTGAFGIYTCADIFGLWLKPKVLSYIPFACWDLSSFMFGRLSSNAYASFGKSLAVDIITILVLLVLSYILFNKKEVKNQ
jgi:ABC-2 type transport system permease protein